MPIQTLIIPPWLLLRKMIISQLELGPPVLWQDSQSWSNSIEEPIAEADEEVSRLEKWLVETNEEIEHRKQKDEAERKARAR